MNLIKLPVTLGIMVVDILKKYNIEPRKYESGPAEGMLSFLFTSEELNLITQLIIENPTRNCLDGIENLKNLEELSIKTHGNTAYNNVSTSITDKDILKISKLSKLKILKIDNQSLISWVCVDNLGNLEELEITRNSSILEISGLDNLHKLKYCSIYGNKELYIIQNIDKLINNNELDALELDVLHYSEIVGNAKKLNQIINCNFIEVISDSKVVSYSYYQMLLFHKKCLIIANEAKKFSHDKKSQIVFVEYYLAKNVFYDYQGKDSVNRAHFDGNKQKGKKNGVNSAYNGIMFGSAVCEGYTRSMQYILKLLGIKTKNVDCIGGANRILINKSYHNLVTLPDKDYHSIIRIDDENAIYYCDPCWDSCHFHRKDASLPYCMLTKKEMSKTHTMSFEEDNVIYDIAYPRDYVLKIIQHINLDKEDNQKRYL